MLAEPAGAGAMLKRSCLGRNDSSDGKAGSLQSDSLYILPTITRPTEDILVSVLRVGEYRWHQNVYDYLDIHAYCGVPGSLCLS